MIALQIRDVPEEVRDVLVERARARGQSMQAFLLALIQAEAQRARNAAVLARFAKRTDGTRSTPGQTAAELATLRGAGSE
ncbi:MAG: FitA-like ribbon-helix-helix domain-containing protein [Pseudonocardiaceae bacterium]